MTRRHRALVALLAVVLVGGCGTEGGDDYVRPATTASAGDGPASPPGPDDTGVPPGTVLEPSGDLDVTEDGAVVDGLDITGCVVVRADDVTIQNTRIRCADPDTANVVQVADGATGLLVQDTEIDGMGTADIGVGWSDYTLRRVEVHRTNDGARLGDDVLIERSWFHDMIRQGELHPDCVQATQGTGITLRGNTFDVPADGSGDLNNAAIMLGSETGKRRLEQVLVVGNWLNGGNYTVNVRQDTHFDDVVFRGNVYGPDSRYGPAQAPAGVVFDGETMSETDQVWAVNEVG
ncbi:hypothetical protein [Modestobacter italicus]|uniref:hypothetical protein n=1 Tax=Modestobacter italicus (strain DSM 44449 / CECT 9708 / BC 501) TaxID=2732864 RepID=UPI001412194B|nr:hypothetical protein [Modestobacter marinus]